MVADPAVYDEAARQGPDFWAQQAGALDWFRPWDSVLEWDLPFARWFDGGTLNVSYNCLDRHVAAGRGDKVAFHWEGEPGDTRTISYSELLVEVSRFANVLRGLGVGRGDRVAVYMPMVPELAVAMLACTRIGAVHSVVFGGFSSDALRDRILDAEARVVVTADGGWRAGAGRRTEGQRRRGRVRVPVRRPRGGGAQDRRRHRRRPRRHGPRTRPLVARAPERERPGGRGARPTCASRSTWAPRTCCSSCTLGHHGGPQGHHAHHRRLPHPGGVHPPVVFDLHPDEDVYWCAADIGWVTGHSYIVYGPLANGATSVLYEGTPDHPGRDRWWSIVERYGVTILYCAPTAIRTFMKWGAEEPASHDLSSLRVLGSVGEPINPEAWMWYSTHIGGGRCPVVDTWWQTETGAIMIAPLPGITVTKPGSATFPLPGIGAEVVDEEGTPSSGAAAT